MVFVFELNLEFEDNGKGKLLMLGGVVGWWCGFIFIWSKIWCILSGVLRMFMLCYLVVFLFSYG